jgi:hypothetical protein
MGSEARGSCPVCTGAATVTDWRPRLEWVVVEGCACGGFSVWAPLLEDRLRRLSPAERADLAATIQGFRAMNHEAWVTSADGGIFGRLVILTRRPERPS